MLRLDQITYRIGARTLFDGAGAATGPGRRVGLWAILTWFRTWKRGMSRCVAIVDRRADPLPSALMAQKEPPR